MVPNISFLHLGYAINTLKGWSHINQDELGTAAECKKALEKAVKHGKNVVLGVSCDFSVYKIIVIGYYSHIFLF